MPFSRRTPMLLFALLGPLIGLRLAGPPASSSPLPYASVTPMATVEVDGSFEVRHYDVAVPAPAQLDAGVAAARIGSVAQIELPDAPHMVIIDADVPADAMVIRSRNAGEWSEWVELASPVDEAPDGLPGEEGANADATPPIGPVWIGDDAEMVEIKVFVSTSAAMSVETLRSTDPRDPAPATANAVIGEEAAIPDRTALALAAQPGIQPRSAWAGTSGHPWASGNSGCASRPTVADSVRAAIVHHTVNTNDYAADQVDDVIRGIYRYHVNSNGWCDVAYNFFVDRFGVIWEGRTGSIDSAVIGGHARGFNTATVGVALLGQHQDGGSPAAADVSAASQAALQHVVGWKLGQHGVDPKGTVWLKNRSTGSGMKHGAGQWIEVPTVMGHRDLGQTSCPGSRAYPLTSSMRAPLAPVGQQVGAAPYVFPQWTGAAAGTIAMTVDSAGGIRPAMSGAPANPPPATGAGAVAIAGIGSTGWVLTSAGELRSFGGAPAIAGRPAGNATAVDLAAATSGGGWILTTDGALVAYGGAPAVTVPRRPATGSAVAVSLDGLGNGYVLDRSGALFPVGSAPTATPAPVASAAIDVAIRPDGRSGWVLDESLRLHAFGGAPDLSARGANRSSARAVIASPTGYGGWVLDTEGRLLPFGDVRYPGPVSTHVGHQIAVDIAVMGHRVSSTATTSADGRYASAIYSTFIGEAPSPLQLDHWAWRVDEIGPASVAGELAQSDEWAGAVVNDIYTTALGRAPDDVGRRYWVDQLRRGMRVQDLGTYFYGSGEYYAKAGSAGAYVDALYRELLHRNADPAGRAFWVDQLNRGSSPAGVAGGFYASLESRRDRVTRLFQRVLGRGTDPAGLEYWAGWLTVEDDIRLAAELASSEEYYLRATRG